MTEAKKTPRRQCKQRPWKVGSDPYDIPGEYDVEKHRNLRDTIARPGDLRDLGGGIRMMACHETSVGKELPCVGWLAHQLGPGNNINLRLSVCFGRVDANVETVGEQHQRFEDTLPRRRRGTRKQAAARPRRDRKG